MEKGIKQFGKIFFLSTGVMASAAMLTGCAEEVAALAGGSGDGTRVKVTASFQPLENAALTRAADGLDGSASGFSLLTSEDDASKVRVMVDKNDGSYAAFDYGITGPTAIAAPDPAPTFPSGVNSVNVYGWYPAKSLSGFTVSATQTGDDTGKANYCLSDLMWAIGTTCTREGNTVTPAALSFVHVMSKVKVSLTLAAGVTVKAVKLKSVKPTVTVEAKKEGIAVTGYTLGNASGTAGDITLLSGGPLTSASAAANKVLCGVFPPQAISGALLEIIATYNGGSDQTITYSLEAAKTFATNKEYTMNISLNGANIKTGTVTLTGWDATSGVVNVLEGSEAPTLNTSTVTIDAGSYEDVTASGPGTATAWEGISANPSIATVSTVEGKIRITGVSEGTTKVYIIPTAGVTGGFSSAVCEVTVNAPTTPTTLSALKTWVNDGNASDDTYYGYYVKADGSISTDDTDAIGVVAYYGDAAVDESASDSRILVLATADASSSAKWKTTGSASEADYNDPDALNGIAFTTEYGDNAVYPAAQAAKGYGAGKPDDASIWFLPSKAQWNLMRNIAMTVIPSGASNIYWSSTENEITISRAYCYVYNGNLLDYSKTGTGRKVRTAFAY